MTLTINGILMLALQVVVLEITLITKLIFMDLPEEEVHGKGKE